jgi:hypothetical protein
MLRTALAIATLALVWAGAAQAHDIHGGAEDRQVKFLEQLAAHYRALGHELGIKPKVVTTVAVPTLTYTPPPGAMSSVIYNDLGGKIYEYNARWFRLAAMGGKVDIMGGCESACTLVMAHIPKERICFGRNGYLAFHQARRSPSDNTPAPEATHSMFESYPDDIRGWLVAKGGVDKIPYATYWTISAPELWQMGYRRCTN